MLLSTQQQFQACISSCEDGQLIAHYKMFTLRSVYQPIFNSKPQIIGVEALVRITHDNKKQIRPDLFFHSDTYSMEDKINVERLSRVIHIRNFAQSKYKNLRLFLNLLPSVGEYFAAEDMKTSLLNQRLKDLDISTSQLVMEVVELDACNETSLKYAMQNLEKNGFSIAIDDYGTRASTKERVTTIKPSIIKIDRSLMLGYMTGNHSPLLNAIELAQKINSEIVVEGIESQEQLDAMLKLNIDMFQGYFLAMPEPIPGLCVFEIA
ncbi:EAL domain-containing protein [Vibrio sinensis]|uniref:EAL domain-containing protein n=1 Tax=Vibrio sinensis TaxID=2302434 RepID=A0A3A6R2F5_9VIBR|nr:EAL domain-containing protein [Vibrio sinensis]RJX75514.1 EAL domain-containing protein [Vibrio sinensis]